MKKFFLLLGGILLGMQAFSQCVNLQFNQVLMLATTTTLNSGVTYTVPAGKVWKIENIMYSKFQAYCTGDNTYVNWYVSRINGNLTGDNSLTRYASFAEFSAVVTAAANTTWVSGGFPKWMGAGNSIELYTYDSGGCFGTVPVNYLSVIEFNCLP